MTDKLPWRVLPWRTDDAYTCMAIDKVIAESVAAGGPPTLRFYRWAGNGAVSYGASQAVTDFDTAYCDQQGIPYVRRFTGGRVMYHGPHDLTYALVAPLSLYPTRLPLTTDTSHWIIEFLEELGLSPVTYTGNSSILVSGKKISGSSPHYEQKRAVFQHGGVFCHADYATLSRIFKVDESLVRERITTLTHAIPSSDLEHISHAFQSSFLRNIPHQYTGDLTYEEMQRVEELRLHYASTQWRDSGTLPMGICTINWGVYPEVRAQLPPFMQKRLIDKPSE